MDCVCVCVCVCVCARVVLQRLPVCKSDRGLRLEGNRSYIIVGPPISISGLILKRITA